MEHPLVMERSVILHTSLIFLLSWEMPWLDLEGMEFLRTFTKETEQGVKAVKLWILQQCLGIHLAQFMTNELDPSLDCNLIRDVNFLRIKWCSSGLCSETPL